MKSRLEKQGTKASITVFLCLVMLLILSLLFTIIEGARVSTAKVYAERALTTAMDSVLAEFYEPLWKEYHVFGLDVGGFGSETNGREEIEAKLAEYMSYTFTPNRDKNQVNFKMGLEFYDISIDSIAVNNQTMMMEYQGKLLINQAVEYMKYKEIGDGTKQLLNMLLLMEKPKKVSIVYEEKQKVEEELVQIDEGVLELMELLDGLKTSKQGIEVRKDGGLITTEFFIKKISFKELSKEAVGINQESIFQALKDRYVNPMHGFERTHGDILALEQVGVRIEEIRSTQKVSTGDLLEEQEKLKELKAIHKKSARVKQQIKATKERIKQLDSRIKELQEEIGEQEAKKRQFVTTIRATIQELSRLNSELQPLINRAITIMDQIMQKVGKAETLISQYEESLYREKENIGEDILESLEENLRELKRYTAVDGSGYNFAAMKESLVHNQSVLIEVGTYLKQGVGELDQEIYERSRATFQKAASLLSTYQTQALTLDYSTLVLNNTKGQNPIGKVGAMLQQGMTGFVMDQSTISKASLGNEQLPSEIAAMAGGDAGVFSELASFFEHAAIGGNSSGMGNLFGSFDDGSQFTSMIGDGVNTVAQHFLYQEYLKEHFTMFSKEGEDIKTRKPSVLAYEQEYLLEGKASDQENLSAVISRLIFLRTIFDFVSILGDKTKCAEAKLAAATLVGFTGLPILISMTQTLILLVWSFAEALVDTCALMMGKEVSIMKKNIDLEFTELFLLNRSFIQTKAAKIVKTKEFAFSYHDYLRLFLLLQKKEKLAYRSMDLMQENIQIRYEVPFLFQNCLFGFRVKAGFLIKPKFLGISFVQKYQNSTGEGFAFSAETAYSY